MRRAEPYRALARFDDAKVIARACHGIGRMKRRLVKRCA
jgi:hypothetical protein